LAYARRRRVVKVAYSVEGATKLIEVGFIEALNWGNVKIFKRRK